MKTKNRGALLMLAFVFLLPLSARSESGTVSLSLEVTPFGGYNFFENDQNPEDKPLPGGRIGYDFTKHFGLEDVVEYRETNDNKLTPFVAPGFGGARYRPEISDHDMTAFNVGAGAKYRLAENVAFRINRRDYMVTEPALAQAAKYEAKPEPKAKKPILLIAF